MIRKIKHTLPVLLLVVFLIPSVVKLGHHHHHDKCSHHSSRGHMEFKEICAVCDFEFSVFSSTFETVVLPDEQPVDSYFNNYRLKHYFNHPHYSFLLRAPPSIQI